MVCMHSLIREAAMCNERKTYTASLLYTLSCVFVTAVMLQTEPDSS
jgi:hypothetical protein